MAFIDNILNNEYIIPFLILLGFFVIAKVTNYIVRNYLEKITKRTATDIDDMVVKFARRLLNKLILFLGFYIALDNLSILNPYKNIINGIFYVIIVLVVSHVVASISSFLIHRWFKVQKRFEKTPRLLNKVIAAVIYIIAVLIVLGHFEVEITPLIATLGLGGLAVGLALQSTLSNFFAGLHIISDKPVSVGDFIELDGMSGFVDDIGWRSTRIKTFSNNIVVVPNSKLADSTIKNYNMPSSDIGVIIPCGVSYESNLEKVEKVTLDVAKEFQKNSDLVVKDFEPLVRFHTFGDSNINFNIIMRARSYSDRFAVIHGFIKDLKKRYDKEGIEISWPVRKIYYGNKKP